MEVNEEQINSAAMKSQLIKRYEINDNDNFITYFEKIESQLKSMNKVATYKRYRTVIKMLKELAGSPMLITDIDHEFLSSYKVKLVKHGYGINSVHNHFKTIRAIYYQAIKKG